jgi:hypothetical protein
MKKTIRITLDIAMPVLMLLLMAYTLVGKAAHEWIGIALLGIMILSQPAEPGMAQESVPQPFCRVQNNWRHP